MGRATRIELTTSRATIWRSNQLSYTRHIKLVRLKRFELLTHGLEGRCSIQLSYRRIAVEDGAGDGNRTHAASLEGWNSTIELHPHYHTAPPSWQRLYIIALLKKIVKRKLRLFPKKIKKIKNIFKLTKFSQKNSFIFIFKNFHKKMLYFHE